MCSLPKLLVSYFPCRARYSQSAGLLVALKISKTRLRGAEQSFHSLDSFFVESTPFPVRERVLIFKTRLKIFPFDIDYFQNGMVDHRSCFQFGC